MVRWYDGLVESVFKPIPGGYLFQSPNPWLVGRPRYYLANEAQKAAIGECIARRQRLVFPLMLFGVLLMVGSFVLLGRLQTGPAMSVGVGVVVLLVTVMVIPHVYFMRMVRPIIKGLPRSDQRITAREQFLAIAVGLPAWMLYVGLGGAVLMILGSGYTLIELALAQRLAGRWMQSAFSVSLGVVMVVYFAGLVMLKAKRRQTS